MSLVRPSEGVGLWLSVTLSLVLCSVAVQAQEPAGQQPHYDYREKAEPYSGPGREIAEPKGLKEIAIGYFGPSDPEHPDYGALWTAAQLAIEEVNSSGGYRGVPYRLLPVWSENPWGTGVAQVVRLAYEENIWALVGSVDGSTTHLVSQVVAKARLPQINPGATDQTANLANVPWTFSCLPGEHLQVDPLINLLLPRVQAGSFALISTVDHDSRVFADELMRRLSVRGRSPDLHAHFDQNARGAFDFVTQLRPRGWSAIVVAAPPLESAQIVAALRSFYRGPVFGSPAFGRARFLTELEARDIAPGEVVFPHPADIAAVARFSTRSDVVAVGAGRIDFAAAQTYDAVHLLAKAIEIAGLNRVRIHDALRAIVPWRGVAAGPILWDRTGHNTRPVEIGTVVNGRVASLPEGSPAQVVNP